MMTGFFEIGVYNLTNHANLGTLWRSAYQLGAHGIFTIGRPAIKQHTDTVRSWKHIPYRAFEQFDDFLASLPFGCQIVGVEMGGEPLSGFQHPERCVYLLGAEDNGLPKWVVEGCHKLVTIESVRYESYNVAVSGSLVMYSRLLQAIGG